LEFKLGNIYMDAAILKIAAEAARKISDEEAQEIFKENPLLEDKILYQRSSTL